MAGIQYNFCKNPACVQFGAPPPGVARHSTGGPYELASGGKHFPLLKCKACGESPPLKSNLGIAEEVERLVQYITPTAAPSCPNEACENHIVPLGTRKAYRSSGTTSGDSKRYQCTKCRKTFSIPKPTQRQRDTHYNKTIFKMLTNRVPLSRIVSMLGISWKVLYHRIDFIHQQCLAFAADRERKLATLSIRRLYLAVDKQDHLVNWTERKDKRNVVLSAIASADNATGYVFGIHPNFDSSIDRDAVESDARACGDAQLPPPHRKYARLWLEADYIASAQKINKRISAGWGLEDQIAATYASAAVRDDVEVFDEKTREQKLPNYGMQVHAEYTMIAHFYLLKRLLGHVDKWRFFLDQESGIRSACLSAFHTEVAAHDAEAFYVKITKDLTVDAKRALLRLAEREFQAVREQYPDLKDRQIEVELLKQRIVDIREIGQWKDRWVQHPAPSMSEPEKSMCWLTAHEAFDEEHVAWLYNKASLHSIDAFLEKVRRRLTMLERSMHSSSNAGRSWSGYAAYNPAMVVKLLEIFRVVNNFIDTRKKKGSVTTPAMRLGLADAPLDYGDVLYFVGQ